MFYKKEENDADQAQSDDEDGGIDREAYHKDFKTLEISVDASPEEATDAYLRLKEAYSPDLVFMSSPVKDAIEKKRRQDMIGQIEAAYRSLQRLFEKSAPSASPQNVPDDEDAVSQEWRPAVPDEDEERGTPEAETEEAVSQAPAAAEGSAKEVGDFSGQTLREIREKLDVSLDQIYQETKIRIPTLENLENENFSELPPEVYIKGFVKSYARCLSLDPMATLGIYMTKFQDWQRAKGARKPRRQHHAPFRFSRKKGEAGL